MTVYNMNVKLLLFTKHVVLVQRHKKCFQRNRENWDNLFNPQKAFTPFPSSHKVLSLLWSTFIMLASFVSDTHGECKGHMNSINFVRFVFPDSSPTGNPKSGEIHSWWSEGKLDFFLPFPHHRHIHVIAEHCVSHKPDKDIQMNPKSARPDLWSLFKQHSCFSQLFVIWQTFPDHSRLGRQGWWRRLKYSKLFGKDINVWQMMTVHARGANACVTMSFDHSHEKQAQSVSFQELFA